MRRANWSRNGGNQMQPRRKKTVNGHVVEEYYWHGDYPVYVDNKLATGTFEQVCAKLEPERGRDDVD